MKTRLGRTLSPAAAPVPLKDIVRALPACFSDSTGGFEFENEIMQDFDQRYCLLLSSGKAALVAILQALRKLYPDRDEVLVPAFTCYSVPAAIKKAGLKVTLCDTGEGTLDLDKEQLRDILDADRAKNRILCVIVTHLFGCPADFTGIREIVGEDIPIVEDAAQAMGGELDNTQMGTQGDVGFFSLGRGKALSTVEGGVIVTNRPDLGDILSKSLTAMEIPSALGRIKMAAIAILTTLFQHPNLFWFPRALPFLNLGETLYEEEFPVMRMSAFQKRLGLRWRNRLKRHQDARALNRKFWQDNIHRNDLRSCTGEECLSPVRFPLLLPSVDERKRVLRESDQAGCGVMPAYPKPINQIHPLRSEFEHKKYPNAQILADCLITIPVHEFVSRNDRKKIMRIFQTGHPD